MLQVAVLLTNTSQDPRISHSLSCCRAQIAGVLGVSKVQFAVLAIAAGVGWRQLSEARKLREGSARPFVVVDFEIDENIEISLAISNLGATLARDVQIVFDYPFDSSALAAKEGEERAIDRFTRRLAEGIPSLPPGKKIRTLIDLTNHRGEPGNLRDAYIATATYTSAVTGKTYTDTYRLDIGIYWGRIWVTKKGVHEIYGQLEKIAKEMAKWSPSGGGLLTLDRREGRRRATEIDASYETRTAHGPRKLAAKIRY